jgi:ABC-2 type transport system ATP-binding protein
MALTVERLSVRFRAGLGRSVDALRELDLAVGPGEILGVLGPNGSGKTTLFRVLCGEIRPSAGRAAVLGAAPGARGLRTRVGYQPDGPVPFPAFRAAALLRYFGGLLGLPRSGLASRVAALLERVGLAEVAGRRVGALSTGMQKRLALDAALLADPELLLLDEPTAGLDPFGSRIVLELLRETAAAGTAVVMASHRLDEVEEIAGRVVLLHRGAKVAEGPLDELLGGDSELLEVRGASASGRAAVEASARAAGMQVAGWSRRRRHPFELFRQLEQDGAAGGPRRPSEA